MHRSITSAKETQIGDLTPGKTNEQTDDQGNRARIFTDLRGEEPLQQQGDCRIQVNWPAKTTTEAIQM